MSEAIKKITIEQVCRTDGSTSWNWSAFGADKLLNEDDAETLREAVASLNRWLGDWTNE